MIGTNASVWDVEAQSVLTEFSLPERVFSDLAISPDGKRLAVSHLRSSESVEDGRVEVWDLASKKLLATLRDRSGASSPTFAASGQSLLTVSGGWIKAWDLGALPGLAR